MRSIQDKDAVAFLPDADVIRHTGLPWWARHGVLWMGFFLLVAVSWACISPVDIIVAAQGRLISDHPTIIMKPLERTVIKEIHVTVGDRVHAGQVLATFDPVFSRADKERLATEVCSYDAQYERLAAEFAGNPYRLSPDPTKEARIQADIFQKRQRFYAEKLEYFDREIERITKTRQSLQENLALQRKRLAGFKDIEAMLAKAKNSQAVSPRDLKEAQLTRMQLEADISDKENNMLVLDSEFLSKNAERDAFCTDWRIEIAEELVKAQTALTSSRKEFDKARQMASYVELRAPEDAVVHDIAPMSIGSAVREAEALVTLVPLGGTVEVEVEIRAEDIGKVNLGDHARIKVSAFPFQKYGTLAGTVRVISEDSFSRQPGEQRAGASAAFYRSRIQLATTTYEESNLLERLIPGMEVQAEILIGQRKIIEYLTYPIIKSINESIHEP